MPKITAFLRTAVFERVGLAAGPSTIRVHFVGGFRAVWLRKNFEMLVLCIEAIVSSQTFYDMFLISSFTFVMFSFAWKNFCFGMTLESPSRAVSKNYFARPFS